LRPAPRSPRLAVQEGFTVDAFVRTDPTVEEVDTGPAQEPVVAFSALDVVIAAVAVEEVIRGIADQCVVRLRSRAILDPADDV
jgi:hypothetical protein